MPDMETQDDKYKSLSVLTAAMMAGILLFAAVVLIVHYKQGPFIHDGRLAGTISAIAIVVVALLMIAAAAIYKRRINALGAGGGSAKQKWEGLTAISITHLAICEVPAMLSVVLFLLFGDFLFFLPVAMCLVEMMRSFPRKEKIDNIIP